MTIDRQEFINELKLREQIRKIIKVAKSKKAAQNQRRIVEEEQLRLHIRGIIKEISDPGAQPTHRATGIKVLDDEVLQNVIPIFKRYYMQLDNPEKRESFRSHIVNAAENLLKTVASGEAPETALKSAPAPIAEQDIAMNVENDPMGIPIKDDSPDPDESAKGEFRTGMEAELTPDQEVGALRAQTAFNGPDTTIEKAYKDLGAGAGTLDADLFGEYLITNLKLHFDDFEEAITMTPEPTTPSYEEASAAALPPEEDMPPGPEGMPPAPEEEMGPPAPAGPVAPMPGV